MAPRKTIDQETILDGAIAVMEQLGYEKLSVRNIAHQLKMQPNRFIPNLKTSRI